MPRRQGFNFYNTTAATAALQYHSDVIITKSGHTEDCFVAETFDQKISGVAQATYPKKYPIEVYRMGYYVALNVAHTIVA